MFRCSQLLFISFSAFMVAQFYLFCKLILYHVTIGRNMFFIQYFSANTCDFQG